MPCNIRLGKIWVKVTYSKAGARMFYIYQQKQVFDGKYWKESNQVVYHGLLTLRACMIYIKNYIKIKNPEGITIHQ